MAETARASILPELERYELGELIGSGSMGAVYEATDDEGRVVALKILHAEVAEHEMALTRFEREVELAQRIDHSAVPTIFDHGRLPDGRFYLAMERLHGESLEDWWHTPRPILEAMELLLEALGPLTAAHALGIVHRDLKPENVFVTDREGPGRVRLLDFGIARHVDAEAKAKTATGVSVGTPVYMSPEQATKPRLASFPTDVWSFGVMMYEVLCGELPFDGDTPHAVIIAVATEAHVPLRDRAPGVHPALVALVERCLEKHPSRRPSDAGELEGELRALLGRGDVRASLVGTAAAPPPRRSTERAAEPDETPEGLETPSASGLRRRAPATRRRTLGVAAALLLGAVVVGLMWPRETTRENEEPRPATETREASREDGQREDGQREISPEDVGLGPVTELRGALGEQAVDEAAETPGAASESRARLPRAPAQRSTGTATPGTNAEDATSTEERPDVERPDTERPDTESPDTESPDTESPDEQAPSVATTPTGTAADAPVVAAEDDEGAQQAAAAPTNAAATSAPTPPPTDPAPTTAPATPTSPRTKRRVIRRRAEPAPTRPGFVTF